MSYVSTYSGRECLGSRIGTALGQYLRDDLQVTKCIKDRVIETTCIGHSLSWALNVCSLIRLKLRVRKVTTRWEIEWTRDGASLSVRPGPSLHQSLRDSIVREGYSDPILHCKRAP